MLITLGMFKQESGYCARGLVSFLKVNGFDAHEAVSVGIPSEKLRALDDHMINRVLDVLEAKHGK